MKLFMKFAGVTNWLCAILLLLSWCSIGLFMWAEISSQDFSAMVQNPAWIPINIFYLIATLLLIPGTIGLYNHLGDKTGKLGLWGFLLTLLGIVWFTCIQFYETFFWPVIASESPALFQAVGFSPTNSLIRIQYLLSGAPWLIGFILIGVATFKSGLVAKWAAVIFIVGAALFGVGMAFPLRTLGVILLCIGLFKIGTALRKLASA